MIPRSAPHAPSLEPSNLAIEPKDRISGWYGDASGLLVRACLARSKAARPLDPISIGSIEDLLALCVHMRTITEHLMTTFVTNEHLELIGIEEQRLHTRDPISVRVRHCVRSLLSLDGTGLFVVISRDIPDPTIQDVSFVRDLSKATSHCGSKLIDVAIVSPFGFASIDPDENLVQTPKKTRKKR